MLGIIGGRKRESPERYRESARLLDDALAAELAGVAEDHRAVALQMFVVEDAVRGGLEQAQQSRLAGLEGLPAQVLAIQLQEIESEQDRLWLDPGAILKAVEHRAALVVEDGDLAVDHAGPAAQPVHGIGDRRIALRPVVTIAGHQPDAGAVTAGDQPETVMLDLVQPSPRRSPQHRRNRGTRPHSRPPLPYETCCSQALKPAASSGALASRNRDRLKFGKRTVLRHPAAGEHLVRNEL